MAIYKITKQVEERVEKDYLLIKARDALDDLLDVANGFPIAGSLPKYEALLEEINTVIGRPSK